MYPHFIRLRGPWETVDDAGQKRRIHMPGDWHTIAAQQRHLSRKFGLPRLLDADESVILVCNFVGLTECALNGSSLAASHVAKDAIEFEITKLLQPRNEVIMTWSASTEPPEVALEIRGPVFLRDVHPTADGWAGQVIGESRKHLEVHLLAQGRAVARVPVQANRPFVVNRPEVMPEGAYNPQAPPWSLELIEMANRWYSLDFQVSPPVASD